MVELGNSQDAAFGLAVLCDESVSELQKANEEAVKELRQALGGALPESGVLAGGLKTDDLFLLRYVLSAKGDLEQAKKRILDALEWRSENAKALTTINEGGKWELDDQIQEYFLSALTGELFGREPVSVSRLGVSDCKSLMSKFSVEQVTQFLTFEKERMFRKCDCATRETGRLVKSVSIIDLKSFSMMSSRFDKRILSAIGASSKLSSSLYPQLQSKTVIINPPSMIGIFQKTLAAVMPKSSMEKMVVCSGKMSKSVIADCPFSARYGVAGAVPAFLGGDKETPRALLPLDERPTVAEPLNAAAADKSENDIEKELDQQPFEHVNIGPRSYALIKVPVDAPNSTVYFKVQVDQHSLQMAATMFSPEQDDKSTERIVHVDSFSAAPEKDAASSRSTHHRQRSISLNFEYDSSKLSSATTSNSRDVRSNSDHESRSSRSDSENDDDNSKFEVFKTGGSRAKNLMKSRKRRHSKSNMIELPPSPKMGLQPTLVPMRLAKEDGVVKGNWTVDTAGTMYFKFDNTFSKWRSKKVSFKVLVSKPDSAAALSRPNRKRIQRHKTSHVVTIGQKGMFINVTAMQMLALFNLILLALNAWFFFSTTNQQSCSCPSSCK